MSNPSNRHDGPSTSAVPLHIIAISAAEEQFQTAVSHGIEETSFWFVELLLQFSDFVSVPVHNAHDLIGAFYGGGIPLVAESFH
jgi:hypothetical protein